MLSLEPEQARFLLDTVYLPGVQNEHRLTTAIIGAIPHDKGTYRPDEISKTALDLAWHIVATEMRFMGAVAAGAFDFSPSPLPESIHTSAALKEWYAAAFGERVQAIQGVSDGQLCKVVDFRGMFQMPAVMYLGFVLHHTVHHRGQLSMYLRPMGAKVPSIYGESYDAAEARKASMQTA